MRRATIKSPPSCRSASWRTSLGKGRFEVALGAYVDKPAGKPALVPESDKRPAIDPAEAAAADFSDEGE